MKQFLSPLMLMSSVTLTALAAQADVIHVSGTVISANDGEPLIGATVVSDSNKLLGTSTDIDGNFELDVPEGSSLIISYIGYTTVTEKVAPKMEIRLHEDTELLDEVVVVGYSTQKKADVTGAISSVSADELAKQNENNPVKALQGRVPGMNVTADGNPSGASTVRIRGNGTLNNNDPPLYYRRCSYQGRYARA